MNDANKSAAPSQSASVYDINVVASALSASRGTRSVVLLSGAFDLIHGGHVRFLNRVREQADIVVVGVNSDERIRAKKGETRPVIPEEERAFLVQSLKCVDYVFIKRDSFIPHVIDVLAPDKLIFTIEHEENAASDTVLHKKYAELYPSIELVFLNREGKGFSTTKIISDILKRNSVQI